MFETELYNADLPTIHIIAGLNFMNSVTKIKTIKCHRFCNFFLLDQRHFHPKPRNSSNLPSQMILQKSCNAKAAEQNPAFAERSNEELD